MIPVYIYLNAKGMAGYAMYCRDGQSLAGGAQAIECGGGLQVAEAELTQGWMAATTSDSRAGDIAACEAHAQGNTYNDR